MATPLKALPRSVMNNMLDHGSDPRFTAWLVLTGLFMTIPAILLLPSGAELHPPASGKPGKPGKADAGA
jgi:hypothetical protein